MFNLTKKLALLSLGLFLFLTQTIPVIAEDSKEKKTHNKPDEKILRVFISWPGASYEPCYRWNKEKKTFEGFDPEIIQLILKDQNLKFKFVYPQTKTIHPRIEVLTRDLADISIRAITITDERKKKVDFSTPYFSDGISVMVKKGSPIKKLSDLKGKKLLAFEITNSYDYAKKHKLTNHIVTKIDDKSPFEMLSDGAVDAFIYDKSFLDWVAKKDKSVQVWEKRLSNDFYAIGVQKGNQKLLNQLNASLKKFIKDGTIEKIFKKHGLKWTELKNNSKKTPDNKLGSSG